MAIYVYCNNDPRHRSLRAEGDLSPCAQAVRQDDGSYTGCGAAVEAARSTTRERKERRADRRREWADSRTAKANAAAESARQMQDAIPFGQPILVGHHSEKRHRRDIDRIQSNTRKAVDHWNMADRHERVADGIDQQLRTSIYSDDDDAVDQLRARIARLEAERDRIKTFNRLVRKAGELTTDALAALDDKQRKDLASIIQHAPYHKAETRGFPPYVLSNLGGNIRRNKQRLAKLESLT